MRNILMRINKVRGFIRKKICSIFWETDFQELGENVKLELYGKFKADKGLKISRNVTILVERGASLSIGKNVYIGEGSYIKCYGGDLKIGDDVSINAHAFINACGGVSIGNDTRIAAKFVCIASNHIFSDSTIPMRKQGIRKKGIVIGENVWVGANVKILDGVSISKNCVVAAGAVVNKSLENEGIYAGVPAKFKKHISES